MKRLNGKNNVIGQKTFNLRKSPHSLTIRAISEYFLFLWGLYFAFSLTSVRNSRMSAAVNGPH